MKKTISILTTGALALTLAATPAATAASSMPAGSSAPSPAFTIEEQVKSNYSGVLALQGYQLTREADKLAEEYAAAGGADRAQLGHDINQAGGVVMMDIYPTRDAVERTADMNLDHRRFSREAAGVAIKNGGNAMQVYTVYI
ncbi:hypothetical protein NYP18_08885 [Corynebacterium sp. YIM 101645]|uniref:Secreted protein n=1 Tax=Corynebacterium lemuris TaxID=1859292 RepID=A0ABT2FX07_9CORY|nr:hypothetical protein [Corynebacterium lemuris]MCS5479773.1 hypothetical protein [Corynebacterium lemuris]